MILLLGLLSLGTVVFGYVENGRELVLVQAVWRHGDRSPTKTYKNDPYQEDAWTFGGGGFGQLSPKGMQQHLGLGQKLRARYINSTYLSPIYNSKEIYIRSTDVNRTIISALSNMIGMYSQPQNAARKNIDYPDDPAWPAFYVPIAPHTVDDDTDYIGNADADCTRQDKLWGMAKTSQELQAFQNSTKVSNLLQTLTGYCGQTIDIDNLWIVSDALFIEQLYKSDLQQKVPWFNQTFYKLIVDVNDQVELYQNGIFNKTLMMNGLDIGNELKKIRGGSLLNDVVMHNNIKQACMNKTTSDCKWINKLKYYVYSAHDTTLYAFFSTLGIQSLAVKPHGYPPYSAGAFVELWRNVSTNAMTFRLMYHPNANQTFVAITSEINGCGGDFCDVKVLQQFAAKVKPDQKMSQWCNVDPTATKSSYNSSSYIFSAIFLLASWLRQQY